MYLGIQGLMPRDLRQVTEDTMADVRAHGFTGVACRFYEPLDVTEAEVKRLRAIMEAGGVDPCQAVAHHPDLVAPDKARRTEGIRAMQHMCKVTRWLGAGNLYVRPGSLNPKGSWYPHPDNHKPQTFQVLVDSMKQVCAAAEDEGILLAVEGHTLSILNTPRRVKQLIEAVGSEALRFNMDPVNFIGSLQEAYDSTSVVNNLFDVLGPYTICGHAKDFCVEDRLVLHIEETVIGQGLLDHATVLRRFEECCPDGYMQIEHLPTEKIPQAREALYRIGVEAGIRWRGLDRVHSR